jgi:von Willebrand factor type A domain
VSELPIFYLQFRIRSQMEQWKRALLNINDPTPSAPPVRHNEYDVDNEGTDDDDYKNNPGQRLSTAISSNGAAKSYNTAPTEYSNPRGMSGGYNVRFPQSIHIPLDIVVVIPVSSSMQGLKITVLRDALRFLVTHLGERDRMGLVTFGSSTGGVPVVQMTSKNWNGWSRVLESIRPVGQKNLRADVVDGANVAMDLLMQRQYANPLASIMLISDSSTSDPESVDFVVQRAEAAK